MSVIRPIVLVLVPPTWEPIPEGMADLRRQVETGYGARLVFRQATEKLSRPEVILFGNWGKAVKEQAEETLHWLAQDAYFTLDWLDFDEVM